MAKNRPQTCMLISSTRTLFLHSNYDAFGNPRFIDSLEPYGFPRMRDSVFNEAFNWGFTNFDGFANAFITTFQVVTLEGWTDIMSRVIDGWSTGPAIIVFTLLIILGGIIALNILLVRTTEEFDFSCCEGICLTSVVTFIRLVQMILNPNPRL